MNQEVSRQDVKAAASASRNAVVSRDGRIRPMPRGKGIGWVEVENGIAHAFIGSPCGLPGRTASVVVTSSSTKRQDMIIAARLAAEQVRDSLAVEFAAGLISRHPGRLDDIKHALTVDPSEHENGLLGIVSERDLERALARRRLWQDHVQPAGSEAA